MSPDCYGPSPCDYLRSYHKQSGKTLTVPGLPKDGKSSLPDSASHADKRTETATWAVLQLAEDRFPKDGSGGCLPVRLARRQADETLLGAALRQIAKDPESTWEDPIELTMNRENLLDRIWPAWPPEKII